MLLHTAPEAVVSGDAAIPKVSSNITTSFFVVKMTNIFSEKYGQIDGFTVIVTTDKTDERASDLNLPKWSEVQDDPTKTYQAIEICSKFSQIKACGNGLVARRKRSTPELTDFVLGADKTCSRTSNKYCNGPLVANTTYFIKLRALTSNGSSYLFTDSPFSQAIKTGRCMYE